MLNRPIKGPLDTPLYRVAYAIVPPVFKTLFRMEIRGTEHVPREGPVVLASNHISNLDPLFLGTACPRQVNFMAKSELWKFAPLGSIVSAVGAFPVNRGHADREAVRKGFEILDAGAVMGMFPEGHRQNAGSLGQPQPGVGLFSVRGGVTTIPAAVEGSDRIIRRRRILPKVRVTFGPPVDLSAAGATRRERQRNASRLIMLALAELLGQEWHPESDEEDHQ